MRRNQTVLVIANDPVVSQQVTAHLASQGVTVIVDADGEAGQARVERGGIDLILLDAHLPVRDGFATCRSLKDNATTAQIPVVMLMASNDPAERQRVFEAGGLDYVTKPFTPDELRARVDSALRMQRMLEEQPCNEPASRRWQNEARTLALEDALRASEAKLHAITAQLPALFWTTNRDLEITSVLGARFHSSDDAFVAFVGCQLTQFGEQLRTDRLNTFIASHKAALRGDSVQFEAECDGRCFEMRIESLLDANDAVIGTLGLALDVTEQRLAEEAERKRRRLAESVNAMEQVLGVIGHELRTPLAGLRAMSEYLMSDENDESGSRMDFVASINKEVISLAEMVNNLLEAARINSGRARWNWTEFDIRQTCEHAKKLIEPLIDASRVTLDFCIDIDDTCIRGDADAIHRLLINLLNNAQKHTVEGKISVILHEAHDADGRWIIMEVRDTGEGIQEHLRGGLGIPFALNSGIVGADAVRGSGLGLAICRSIAAAHGGAVTISSQRDCGASVNVCIRPDLEEPAPQQEREPHAVNGMAA